MAKPIATVSDGPLAERDLSAIESRIVRMDKVHAPTVVLSLAEAAALVAEVRRLWAERERKAG